MLTTAKPWLRSRVVEPLFRLCCRQTPKDIDMTDQVLRCAYYRPIGGLEPGFLCHSPRVSSHFSWPCTHSRIGTCIFPEPRSQSSGIHVSIVRLSTRTRHCQHAITQHRDFGGPGIPRSRVRRLSSVCNSVAHVDWRGGYVAGNAESLAGCQSKIRIP